MSETVQSPSFIAEQVDTAQATRREALEARGPEIPTVGNILEQVHGLPHDHEIPSNQGVKYNTRGLFQLETPLGEQPYTGFVEHFMVHGGTRESVVISMAHEVSDLTNDQPEKLAPTIRLSRNALLPRGRREKVQLRIGEKWRTVKRSTPEYERLMPELRSVLDQIRASASRRQELERVAW